MTGAKQFGKTCPAVAAMFARVLRDSPDALSLLKVCIEAYGIGPRAFESLAMLTIAQPPQELKP